MKGYIKRLISIILILTVFINFEVLAKVSSKVYKAKSSLNGSLNYIINKTKTNGIQDWDAVVLAMAGYNLNNLKVKGKRYIDSKNNDILKELSYNFTTSYAKHILTITASGYDPKNFNGINLVEVLKSSQLPSGKFKDTINGTNEVFINGHIWSMIALEAIKENYDRNKAVLFLEKIQNKDGGFPLTISGKSDIDITAMAITALSMAGKNKNDKSISKALSFVKNNLKKLPKENQTAETLAWIIQAAVSCGDDLSKYVVNNKNIIDELLLYKDKSGGFKHIKNGKVDDIATNQVARALLSYVNKKNMYESIKYKKGNYYKPVSINITSPILYSAYFKDLKKLEVIVKGTYYDEAELLINEDSKVFSQKSSNGIIKFNCDANLKSYNYKLFLRKNGKVVRVILGSLEPIEKSYNVSVRIEGPDKNVLRYDVRVGNKEVYDFNGKKYKTSVPSVYAAVCKALIENNIPFEVTYSSYGPFLNAISNIKTGRFGGYDGWMFMVNSIEPQTGMANYEVKENDKILIYYGDWGIKPLNIEVIGENKINSQIKIKVTSDNSPVKDAVVYVNNIKYITNEEGMVTFIIKGPGKYQIYAEKNGGEKMEYIRSDIKLLEIK